MYHTRKLLSFLVGVLCVMEPLSAQINTKPNILFCIADDASWEHMSAYGRHRWVKTPVFDKIAKEGLLFEKAYTPNAKCAPSRASILTGRNPWQLEAAGNHNPVFPAKFTTFMEVFAANGYATGFTGKGWGPGDAGTYSNGEPRELTGPEYNRLTLTAPTAYISNIDYAANFDEFLKQNTENKPFVFWVGGREPHRRYEYGSGISKGEKRLDDIDHVPPFWMDDTVTRTDMLDYAYEVEYFDAQIGRVLNVLEKHEMIENTIIVITSDNGMPFPRVKGHLYEYDNHMPLAMMWKGQKGSSGRTVSDYISFIDFAPTFLEAAGIDQQGCGMQEIEGKSFAYLFQSDSPSSLGRDYVLLGRERQDVGRPNDEGYPQRAIIEEGYFFVRNYKPGRWPSGNPETGYMDTDGSPTKTELLEANRIGKHSDLWELNFGLRPAFELYNLKDDPFQMNNLAGHEKYRALEKKLLHKMEKLLKQQEDPRMFGRGAIFDRYPYAQEKVRNFYERFMDGEKLEARWIELGDFEQQKWHPGHYLLVGKMTDRSDYLKGDFLGIQRKYHWRDLEREKDVYDFSEIRKDLDFLQRNGRRLVIQIQTKSFDKDIPGGPDYLLEREYEGGFYLTAKGTYNPVFWNPKVEERINALYRALGKEFNREPYVEAVNISETAPKIKNGIKQEGVRLYTDSLYAEALKRQMKVLKNAFPNTVVIQYTNFPKSELERLIRYQRENGIGLGGPDINPFARGLNDPESGVYQYYAECWGKIPLGAAVQHEDYDFLKTSARGDVPIGTEPSVKYTYEFGRDKLHLNYIFWLDRPHYIDQVIEMMRAKDFPKDRAGGLSTVRPVILK